MILDGTAPCPPVTDYKLVDVPDLGYFATDRPYPRGELLIKSTTLFAGYYKRPDFTAEVFDEDGFYRTGDVFAELGPDRFRFLDRRNNVLKLSQGEFVTVPRLEAIFANCDPVRQIYVYGNGERSFLLAVVGRPTTPWPSTTMMRSSRHPAFAAKSRTSRRTAKLRTPARHHRRADAVHGGQRLADRDWKALSA